MKRIRKISPSMMCTDFLNVKTVLDLFMEQEIDYLHIDIMDGHYVPNFALGIDFCSAVFSYSGIPLDIHLMIDRPDSFVEEFAGFENSVISFHPETCYQPLMTIQRIKSLGRDAGIALSPSVSFQSVQHLVPYVDMVCVMTVHPGYAGQRLFEPALETLQTVSRYRDEKGYQYEVEVDGNVSWKNIPRMREAGADVFVAGSSSIFERGGDMAKSIARFRKLIND